MKRLKNALEKRKKKGSKKHRKSQHEDISGGESDEGEESMAGSLKIEQEKLEAEKESILQNKELLEEVLKQIISTKMFTMTYYR